ncbi:hypothetical protein NVP1293O_25 [Vibrio phage 1.293.O._10N.261.52.E1]|nr:hypothetical protein NVP1293O_25 [Vibrio phage 1.293.O._10N.261.52.E1]
MIEQKDPNGLDMHELGAKADLGKPRMELLPLEAICEVAKVMTFGANKYTDGGWRHVDKGIERYKGAMLRHLMQEEFEELDNETGELHAAAVACNALFRLQLILDERRNTEHLANQETRGNE